MFGCCSPLFCTFALAWLECHAVAAVVLDIRKDLPNPIMFLRVLAPVLEAVAVFCAGIELRDCVGERG